MAAAAPDILRDEILRQTRARGAGGSICPSEVARACGEEWRSLLPPVRDAARALAKAGLIDILRKGKAIDPDAVRGVIRLRIRPDGSSAPPQAPG